jgi:hypothetical protein
MMQARKAVDKLLYDTYEKELWAMSYGLRVKKRQELHLSKNLNILSIIEIYRQPFLFINNIICEANH